MSRTVKEIMGRVDYDKKRKIANNTIEYWKDGIRFIRLHDTNIMQFNPDNSIILNSGGWMTVTTKDRINAGLPSGFRLFQKNKVWFVNDIVFADNMILYPDGTVTGEGEDTKKTEKLDKQIKVYAEKFIKKLSLRKIEKPSGGDCWYCSMKTVDKGESLGQAVKDKKHILEHLKENYFVPSLLMNAVETFPISPIAKSYIGYCLKYHEQYASSFKEIAERQIKQSLIRFIRRQVGIAS